MKTTFHDKYGSFDQLRTIEVPRPVPKKDEVLVRVRAAALHVGDCFGVRGTPFLMRIASGFTRPKIGVPGFDTAGEVEAIGNEVTRFRVGEEVFGTCFGSCAEFVCTKESTLAHKPKNLGFNEAAAVPTSALAALHALRDVAQIKPGQRVLVNGAAGGIGTFAVQLAKSFGAMVTGVCSTSSTELVRSLGADKVIDYTCEDFAQSGERYDLIFDNVENRTLEDCRKVLAPAGMLILNSGTGASGTKLICRILSPLAISPFVKHNLRRYMSTPNAKDLVTLGKLLESGELSPVIDRTYPLSQTADALAYVDRGHAHGKVVISI